MIQQRIISKIDREVSRLQNSFRHGLGTREGIFNLRTVIEQSLELQNDFCICFIDYTKAFDRVIHSKMIDCLKEVGIDDRDLQIITKMYWEQTAVVKTDTGLTEEIKKERCLTRMCDHQVCSACIQKKYLVRSTMQVV